MRWSAPVPEGAVGVRLYFAPTRTQVLSVRDVGEPPLAGEAPVSPGFHFLQFAELRWHGNEHGRTLELEIEFDGEQPHLLDWEWVDVELLDSRTPADGARDRATSLYRWREERSPRPSAHRFLFDFDRRTLPTFLPFVLPSAEERRHRLEVLLCVRHRLLQRLEQRFQDSSPSAAVTNAESLDLISSLFWNASAHLYHDGAVPPLSSRIGDVGQAMEHFAAGSLILVQPPAGPNASRHVHGGPDSFFVFLFYEIGLQCRDHGSVAFRAAWNELLPSLELMQKLYIARLSIRHPWLTHYGASPSNTLTPEAIRRIGTDRAGDAHEAEQRIRGNLKELAKAYGSPVGVRLGCSRHVD